MDIFLRNFFKISSVTKAHILRNKMVYINKIYKCKQVNVIHQNRKNFENRPWFLNPIFLEIYGIKTPVRSLI